MARIMLDQQQKLVFPAGKRSYASQRLFFEDRFLHNPYWAIEKNMPKSRCIFFAKVPDTQINQIIQEVLEFEQRSGKMVLFNKFSIPAPIGQVFEIRIEPSSKFLELWSLQPMSFVRRRLKPYHMDYFSTNFLGWKKHPKNVWSSSAFGMHSLLLCHIILNMERYHSLYREHYPLCSWVAKLDTETSVNFWFGANKKLPTSRLPEVFENE